MSCRSASEASSGQPDRVFKQHRALPRQRDLSSAAVEQAHAQLVFERFDLQGDGRLRKEELFGGLAKIQLLCHGPKDLEAKILQLRHGRIMQDRPPHFVLLSGATSKCRNVEIDGGASPGVL